MLIKFLLAVLIWHYIQDYKYDDPFNYSTAYSYYLKMAYRLVIIMLCTYFIVL